MIEMLDRPSTSQSPAGFGDPVQDGQQAFRAIMDAMARPGSVHEIGSNLKAPDGMNAAAASAILALCDYETMLWLAPSLRIQPDIGAYCSFHTGAPRTADPRQAAFAVLDLAMDGLDLGAFAQGTAEYPDRSTTVVVMVPALAGGATRTLAGPGIKGSAMLAVPGLPDDFERQWAANRAAFPLGVDLLFCAGTSVMALPRSTRIVGGAV
jgi:alpha-D-ribose 1-methylphosphonate 5-triphosphate synthase subunit PhnH